jgi:hypothetical protein
MELTLAEVDRLAMTFFVDGKYKQGQNHSPQGRSEMKTPCRFAINSNDGKESQRSRYSSIIAASFFRLTGLVT